MSNARRRTAFLFALASLLMSGGAPVAVAGDEPIARVTFARYVADNGKFCDFASKISCSGQACAAVNVSNGLCGDPALGAPKKAYVGYTCSWTATPNTFPGSQFLLRPVKKFVSAGEGGQLSIQCAGEAPVAFHKPVISSITARYFDPRGTQRSCDFAKFATGLCEGAASCSMPVDNSLCGDPAQGGRKTAEITYRCRYPWSPSPLPNPPALPSVQTKSASEGETIAFACD
jgi:hypothetical protein